MSNYNLTDNVNDTFTFQVNGLSYSMRYPLVEEIEKMQDMATASDDLKKEIVSKKEKNEDVSVLEKEYKKSADDLNNWMYEFISPEKPDSPAISATMKKMNVKVLQNFQTMFKTEFGLE